MGKRAGGWFGRWGAGYVQIWKTEPSVGTDRLKNATSGGAPSNVSWASNWRAVEVGAALSLAARRKRKVEMAKAFIVAAWLIDGWMGKVLFLLYGKIEC